MDKKKIKDIFVCVVIVVVVLTLSILATNKLSENESKEVDNTPILKDENARKNKDTFCGVLITSGTSKINESQHKLFESPRLYADFDKEKFKLSFEGIEGIILGEVMYGTGDNKCVGAIDDKLGVHGETSVVTGSETKILSTLYAYLNEKYYVYINPIYEESEGKYYVIASEEPKELDKVDDRYYMSDSIGVGPIDFIDVKSSDYCDEEKAKYKVEFEIKVQYRQLTDKLEIAAFDKKNNKIEQNTYEIKGAPIKAKEAKNADYYVIKEFSKKGKHIKSITEARWFDYDYFYSTTGAFLNGASLRNEE